jgi:Peptidase family M48
VCSLGRANWLLYKISLLNVVVGVVFGSFSVNAQENEGFKVCLVKYIAAKKQNTLAISPEEAELIVQRIANYIGLDESIPVVKCNSSSVSNAMAWVQKDSNELGIVQGEYILFNPTWVKNVAGADKTELDAIFGHELGHILKRHYYKAGDRPTQETEADKFAGCAVAKGGGNWAKLKDLFARIRPTKSTAEYESYDDAVAAAKKGWMNCGGSPLGEQGWVYLGDWVNGSWDLGSLTVQNDDNLNLQEMLGKRLLTSKPLNVRAGPMHCGEEEFKSQSDAVIRSIPANTELLVKRIVEICYESGQPNYYGWAKVELPE